MFFSPLGNRLKTSAADQMVLILRAYCFYNPLITLASWNTFNIL